MVICSSLCLYKEGEALTLDLLRDSLISSLFYVKAFPSSSSRSSGRGVDKIGPSKSSKVHSKVGSSSFTEGVSSPNVEVVKVGKPLAGSPASKAKASSRRDPVMLEGSVGSLGTVPHEEKARSFSVVNDALGFREFIEGDGGRGFKGFGKKPFSKGSFLRRPRDSHVELEGTDVEDCGSSQGKGDPLGPLSRKESLPHVPRFTLNVTHAPQGNVFVPPYPLDKSRSYFCSPEHAYGVACDIITPADKEHFRSMNLKAAYSEGLYRGFQVMFVSRDSFYVFSICCHPGSENFNECLLLV